MRKSLPKKTLLLLNIKNNPNLLLYNELSQKVECLNKFFIMNKFRDTQEKFFRYLWKNILNFNCICLLSQLLRAEDSRCEIHILCVYTVCVF